MNIGNIITGHVNEFFGLNKDISEERMKICKKCPLYVVRFETELCNSKLFMDPQTDDISLEPEVGYIKGCGCRLKAKTTLPNEECPAGKW